MIADSNQTHPGLTTEQAHRLLAAHGPNLLPEPRRHRLVDRVLSQVRDPMILLLLAAGLVTTLVGDVADTLIIVAVVTVNTGLGTVQELRAERAVAALKRLGAPKARVIRDGQDVELPTGEIVPGDLIRVDAGDVVAADGILVEAHDVNVDESMMTGESMPVDHSEGDEVSAGTVVTRGRGLAQVTHTGADSGMGRIAALIADAPTRPTPLQARLARLSRLLVVAVLALVGLVLVLGLAQGRSLVDMLLVAVSLAVAAVPESLPAVVSISLAMGAYRMARRSAIVRRLPAVETLGSVDVIACDKTGTLTEGRMLAERVWTPWAEYAVTGSGYSPDGAIRPDGRDAENTDRNLDRLLRDIVLCNDAQLAASEDDGDWHVSGDPLEGALLALATKGGVSPPSTRQLWRREHEVPFDSRRRQMTTVHAGPDGDRLVVRKGAPEQVMEQLVGQDVDAARHAAARLAQRGLRVIAVVEGTSPGPIDGPDAEPRLQLVGLVGIIDPPRAAAREVVEACRSAGIRVLLATGDHPGTARTVAGDLGIGTDTDGVACGTEMLRDGHSERVEEISVFARIRPEQKVDIVEALHERGHVVAMTGDGINDAPALRAADIGVAMGDGGTDVAREAAALVLADNDLRTVVAAVEEGRRIFTNIRSFLRYGLSGGAAEIAVMIIAPFLGMAVPLLPAQILWINMLTHGLPGVAFGNEPLDPAVMNRPSHSPQQSILGTGLVRQIALTAVLITATALTAGLLANHTGAHVQTWIFTVLSLSQLGVALALRSPGRQGGMRLRGLDLAVASAMALQLAAIFAPPFQTLLHTRPVEFQYLLLLAAISTIPGLLLAAGRVLRRRTRRPGGVAADSHVATRPPSDPEPPTAPSDRSNGQRTPNTSEQQARERTSW